MIDLKTSYLGLSLKNPIIVSSSGLTNSVEKIKQLEKLGAGAVVLKSLFEEQIMYEAGSLSETSDYPEAEDYIRNYTKNNSLESYLNLIEEAKKATNIPIIASINCISSDEWIGFARDIEQAGADALELNVYYLPTEKQFEGKEYEGLYFDLVEKLTGLINIPIAVKLGYHFTNLTYMVDKLFYRGAKGVVLFNRFYEPDIDIENFKFRSAEVLSSESDIRYSLRWIGIISGLDIKLDLAASTGVHDGAGVIKQLLAGAQAVMICSTLYKYGVGHLKDIHKELEEWMQRHSYKSIDEFRGKMSYKRIDDPAIYERAQFMKYFSSIT